MPENAGSASDRDSRLHDIVLAYLRAVDAGLAPDQQEILAQNPDLAGELCEFFSGESWLKPRLVPPETGPAVPADAPSLLTCDFITTAQRIRPRGGAAAGQSTAALDSAPTVPPVGEATDDAGPGDGAQALPSFPGYEILGVLGRGGMGVVYKARDLALKRIVALKVILAGAHAGEQLLARFKAEAETVARLQHPNIVQIHEVGAHDGKPFIALEFCAGGSLDAQLDGTPLPPRDAAQLIQTLARAMHAAHQAQVIHRDLKPANILLQIADARLQIDNQPENSSAKSAISNLQSAIPKITDFGLAKKLDDVGQTQSGAIMGTPSYMAPEQAEGKGKELGPRADIYALGAILYELLTGRPPFKAATALDTILQVVSDEPVPPTQLQSRTPRDLETICLKCLQKEPAKRYATAADLADELGRYLRGEPILARPIGSMERTAKWVRRNKGLSAGLAAAVLALLLGTALASWQAIEAWTAADSEALQRQAAVSEKKAAEVAREAAETARKTAENQVDRAERVIYAGTLARAQLEFQDNNGAAALALLEECQWNLRGWEHHHLWTRFNSKQQFLGHSDMVTSVCFSPDGKRLVTVSRSGGALLSDTATGRDIRWLNGFDTGIACACFSPDGTRLASADFGPTLIDKGGKATNAGMTVTIRDANNGKDLFTLKGHTAFVTSLCFSPDGKRLASASAAGQFGETAGEVKIWDAEKGQEVLALPQKDVVSVSFHADGKRLAAGGGYLVKIWETVKGKDLVTLKREDGEVSCVCFSPDGKRLASAARNQIAWPGEIKILDADTGHELLNFRGHTAGVNSVCFSPDGKRLASGSGDLGRFLGSSLGELKVWDAGNGQEVFTLKGHTDAVTSVCFSPDGKHLASAGKDQTAQIWDVEQGQQVPTFQGHARGVNSVCFSPDGKHLASASDDHTVRIWDAGSRQLTLILKGHKDCVTSVCFSPDGKRLATATGDRILEFHAEDAGEVKVWDVATGVEVLNLEGHGVCFSPDGKFLALATKGGTGKVCDAATGREILTLQGKEEEISKICFSPDGKRLATASPYAAKIWDAANGQELFTLRRDLGTTCICFSPDGKRLASATADLWNPNRTKQVKTGEITIWDAITGRVVHTIKGCPGVTSISFNENGTRLASAGEDKKVKIWDTERGHEVLALKGHKDCVTSVCFSGDGTRLASASGDPFHGPGQPGEVIVWDADQGQEVRTLKGTGINSACFSPDGKRFALASGDVKIWDAGKGAEIFSLQGSSKGIVSVCFSPDGKRLASGTGSLLPVSREEEVRIWDVATGRTLLTLDWQTSYVNSVCFSPDGKNVAATSNGALKVWDAVTGQVVVNLQGDFCTVCFSPDGKRLASAASGGPGKPGAFKVWDAATGQEVLTIKGQENCRSVCFSPDGKRLATANGVLDRGVGQMPVLGETIVWDVASGQKLLTLGKGIFNSVCFSPDGQYVASGGENQVVTVWDTGKGQEVATLKGHASPILSVSFSPDGKSLLSVGGGLFAEFSRGKPAEVKMWDLDKALRRHASAAGKGA